MRTAASPKSAPARARFRRRYGVRLNIAIKAVASPAADGSWGKDITSDTGRTAARRRCRISRCSAVGTIAQFTKKGFRSSDPAAVLRERNAADGIQIDAQTSKPGWLGEWLDVGYAIDVLHPAATSDSVRSRCDASRTERLRRHRHRRAHIETRMARRAPRRRLCHRRVASGRDGRAADDVIVGGANGMVADAHSAYASTFSSVIGSSRTRRPVA